MRPTPLNRWLLAPCALLGATGLLAQATTPSDIDNDDVIVLSPFEVTGTDDVGYQATSTLGGTRVNTSLKDVGASISVLNEELLRDTGATNLEDVLVLTANTEVGGGGGNFSGSQGFGSPIPELQRDNLNGGVTRIRGLAAADLTRDYFITDVPFDAYNTNRVEVQRGANSALFGLGSPGGIVNNSTIKADFLGSRGKVKVEADQYGSFRTSLDYNYQLNDHIAVRVAGLASDTQYEQKQAFKDDDRAYVSVTGKLPYGFTVRGSFEHGEINSSLPDYMPPNDGITPWINMGSPTWDTPYAAAQFFRSSGDIVPGIGNNQFVTLAANGTSSGYVSFYQDPSNPNPTFGGTAFLRSGRGAPNYYAGVGGNGEWMLIMPRNELQIITSTGYYSDGTPVDTGSAQFFSNGNVSLQLTDRSIFDYRKNLFSGGVSQQWSEWDTYNASLEGNWLDGRLGVEASYFKQEMFAFTRNPLQGSSQRTIYIDPVAYLIGTTDGTGTGPLLPNPTYGRPVIGGLWQGGMYKWNRENARFTGFAEVRFDDFMNDDSWLTKLLGRLRLTGLYEESTYWNETHYSRDQVDPYDVANALAGGIIGTGGVNTASLRAGSIYALPVHNDAFDFLNASSLSALSGVRIGGGAWGQQRDRVPSVMDYVGWDQVSGSFVNFSSRAYNLSDNNAFPASFSTSRGMVDIESKVLVGQSYLWDDTIVLTGTWRNDVQASNSLGAPSWSVNSRVDDPYADSYYNVPLRPLDEDADADTTSWSIVVHTPDFLKKFLPEGWDFSVYKSRADNFQPSGSRVNIFNEQIAPVTGSTEETGFMVSALDGKLSARVNFYETGVLNNSYDIGGVSNSEGILLGLMTQLDNPTNIANGYTADDVRNYLPPQGVIDLNGFIPNWNDPEASTTNRDSNDNGTRDFTAEGMEIEIAYNPTPDWTILVNAGRQETVTSNSYPKLQEYVNDFVTPQWVDSSFAQNYVINDTGTTLAEQAFNTIVQPVVRATLLDGMPSVEQREWRWGLNTSYHIGKAEDGILKWFGDLTVGGGIRWEDEIGIGFEVNLNDLGEYALDPTAPFKGPSMTFIDVFARMEYQLARERKLTLQLNVKDLTDHDELVPFLANPDGSELYRFLEGRLISASATFEF
ncbi:TonB-dependent receptor plug domain-containing protein [Actomonas aquatica]|uniref:TonB-dependent receptor plug domain-containing protein n=1 Tax=Actomonas aquatica TaxID=2866162 RepID=A0ABZ1C3X0_9BACT|nr:TonB-dependent receptor plug domain-containing protein [Opitutus sp. WL0086]WRQ86047.1 TonB-dependent receptor plug domain-containing protein [Opitutus sp. WL0086]